jgi:hypothetical protein
MPSTFSPNKNYELMATGENDNTWGGQTNDNWSIVDLNLGGRHSANVAGSSNVTLTAEQAENLYHSLTGLLTGNIDYIFPAGAGGDYIINNGSTGAFSITVKPSGGTGVVVPQGTTVRLFMDPDAGAAVVAAQPLIVTGGGLAFSSGALRIMTGTEGYFLRQGASLPAWHELLVAAAALWTGTSTTQIPSIAQLWAAAAPVTLSDAATIALDMATFINAEVTIAGDRTLGNPTNTKVQSGIIAVTASGAIRTINKSSNIKSVGITWPVSIADGATCYFPYLNWNSSNMLVLGEINGPS